jgi:DNA-3-methyladenine glycosylase
MKLYRDFYKKDALVLAEDLLGKIIVRKTKGKILRARIVETEGYPGGKDKASHSYMDKKSPRTQTLYLEGGHAYVYLIYGIYHLFNVVAGENGQGQGVLVRAVEPLGNLDTFAQNRFSKNYDKLTSYQRKNLTNGPGKLTRALKIDLKENAIDLTGEDLYLEDDGFSNFSIVTSKRIGIDYAEEARDFLYRFYIKDNPYVSIK